MDKKVIVQMCPPKAAYGAIPSFWDDLALTDINQPIENKDATEPTE